MSHAIYTNLAFSLLFSLLFFSLTFSGTQLLGYHGIFSSLAINLNVEVSVKNLPYGGYNVTIKERGSSYNNTLGIKINYNGGYYYILNMTNKEVSITYYISNSSNIGLLAPFYMPHLSNGTFSFNERIVNSSSSQIESQILTNISVTEDYSELILNFSDLNLTAIPTYYVSQRIIYLNNFISQMQSNYTNSGQIYLYTNISLVKNETNSSSLIIPIIVVVIIVAASGVVVYRFKKKPSK
ncbi:hypothetical protein [Saccharolobus shibatae]|uniref:Uncharacterized protein n=1 Tax=Saccharolobus shibatae TaxID=2286 RepID=A0A8F5BVX6_9CREN|nr:hypothetical protein [Saccharolobus shibatae]QXJ32442.1 hypothetical protein J5U21_02093 [Saccharolobus shibatae]